MAIPTLDQPLANWSTNADTRLTASPATYGTTAAVATAYHAVHAPFIAAFGALVAARDAGTRSSSLVATKDLCKGNLLAYARPLYLQIQANTAVLNADKINLGIKVRSNPSPRPIPDFAPRLIVDSVNGRIVKVLLRDPNNPDRKGMPAGIDGAIVLSAVSPTAPTDPSTMLMQGPSSRMEIEIVFPDDLAPGTQVWLSAVFFNERKQMGPACSAVGTQINFGGSMPMAG